MRFKRWLKSLFLCASLLLTALLSITLQGTAGASSLAPQRASSQQINPEVQRLRQMVHSGQLAPTVNVLDTLAPTTIIQFPLVPSGIKQAFPNATGLVTIVRGNRDDSTADRVTIDVDKMPPNTTFTIFFIEIAQKPFGHVEYVADLATRGDGSGESTFDLITFVAFAMDARNPGTSQDNTEGATSGVNLEHLGMWFSSLQDAQKVLNNDSISGTIFDGGSPPLHAGPQAMTDGQTDPVF